MKVSDILKIDKGLSLLTGNEQCEFETISSMENVASSSLIFVKSRKFFDKLIESNVRGFGIVLAKNFWDSYSKELEQILRERVPLFVVVSNSFDLSMSLLSKLAYDKKYHSVSFNRSGLASDLVQIGNGCDIAPSVFIGEDVIIGDNVTVMAGAVVMAKSKIGDRTTIFPNVTIYPFVTIGNGCRIHSGTVIGADGFGYNYANGVHHKIWHFGGVVIGDDVEIGTNSCVDSGTFSPTTIGSGSKIDNQVQIGHNSILGNGVIMCGQSGVSGSCKLGDFVVLGGKAGVGPSTTIGAGTQVAGASIVSKDFGPKRTLAGFPATDLKDWLKEGAVLRRMCKKERE